MCINTERLYRTLCPLIQSGHRGESIPADNGEQIASQSQVNPTVTGNSHMFFLSIQLRIKNSIHGFHFPYLDLLTCYWLLLCLIHPPILDIQLNMKKNMIHRVTAQVRSHAVSLNEAPGRYCFAPTIRI